MHDFIKHVFFWWCYNHELSDTRSITSIKFQLHNFEGCKSLFISFYMLYYDSLAARGNISRVQIQAFVCIGCWGKAIRMLGLWP